MRSVFQRKNRNQKAIANRLSLTSSKPCITSSEERDGKIKKQRGKIV